MAMLSRDYGAVDPLVFRRDDEVVLYNPLTTKKVFSTVSELGEIPLGVLGELKSGAVSMREPVINRYRMEVDFSCNALCDYCLVYNNPLSGLNTKMSLDTAKRIVAQFNEGSGGGSIMLIGGEPLLNKPVVEYVVGAARGYVNIFSNGMLVDDATARMLAKPHVATFISLDGQEAENHHRKDHRGQPIYTQSLDGYLRLKEYGARTGISCLVTDDNVERLPLIVAHYRRSYGESVFGLSYPHRTRKNEFKVTIESYVAQMATLLDYAKQEGIFIAQIANIMRPLVMNEPRLLACKIVGEQITFYPDGRQTLCTKLDTLPHFDGVQASDLVSRMPMLKGTVGSCGDCAARALCGGGCLWDAALSPTGLDDNSCAVATGLLEPILWSMYREGPKNVIVRPEHLPRHAALLQPGG